MDLIKAFSCKTPCFKKVGTQIRNLDGFTKSIDEFTFLL